MTPNWATAVININWAPVSFSNPYSTEEKEFEVDGIQYHRPSSNMTSRRGPSAIRKLMEVIEDHSMCNCENNPQDVRFSTPMYSNASTFSSIKREHVEWNNLEWDPSLIF